MQTQSKTQEYFYADSNSFHHHKYLLTPLKKLLTQGYYEPNKKLRILDLGCGNGSLTHLIAQQGYEVVGVEESKSGVELANQTFSNCKFVQGSIYNLPFSELGDKFDVVIGAEVIEHLFYPREIAKAAKKVLKPNGQLILTTPYHGYFKNLVLAASGKMDQHFTVLWDGGHIKFFSVKTLSKLLVSEGFTDIKFKFTGRMPYLWKSMLCSSKFR